MLKNIFNKSLNCQCFRSTNNLVWNWWWEGSVVVSTIKLCSNVECVSIQIWGKNRIWYSYSSGKRIGNCEFTSWVFLWETVDVWFVDFILIHRAESLTSWCKCRKGERMSRGVNVFLKRPSWKRLEISWLTCGILVVCSTNNFSC